MIVKNHRKTSVDGGVGLERFLGVGTTRLAIGVHVDGRKEKLNVRITLRLLV